MYYTNYSIDDWAQKKTGPKACFVTGKRFELSQACAHYPLKVACLPIPPSRRTGAKLQQKLDSPIPRFETFSFGIISGNHPIIPVRWENYIWNMI